MRYTVSSRRCASAFVVLLAATLFACPAVAARTLVPIGTSRIYIDIGQGRLAVPSATVVEVVATAARAVAGFYGEFPTSVVHFSVMPSTGRRLNGVTYRGKEPLIVLSIGSELDESSLRHSWIVAHELVHLAFPPVHRRHHWIEEGLATYIEPLARLRAGLIAEADVWRWLLKGIPKGLPQSGDRGLDNTPTWGRTYWGGALFCLLVDIELRRQSDNRYGLPDALRAIAEAGGTMQSKRVWPLREALAIGDSATGLTVLQDTHSRMGNAPVDVDLAALWAKLGVRLVGDRVVFDDAASLAKIRRAMVANER